MAVTVNSDLTQGLVKENWGDYFIRPLYEKNSVLPFALNVTKDCKKGDLVNVPVKSAYTVGSINATTLALNVQTPSISNVQVSIDRPRDVTVDLGGVSREQAEEKYENSFAGEAGEALAEEMESALLGLYSDLTTTAVGDANGQPGEDELIAAIQSAVTAKHPILKNPGDFCLAMADTTWGPLRKLKIFNYEESGEAGQNAASKLALPDYGGIPVRFSTQVASSGGARKSMLFAREAFAWGAQKNPEKHFTDRFSAAQWSYLMTCIGLYGIKTVVASRAWIINSKA